MFLIQDPGLWNQFIHRYDNQNLDIGTLKSKFLTEQLNYQNQISEYLGWLDSQNSGPYPNTPTNTPGIEILTESSHLLTTQNGYELIMQ